MPQGTPCGEKSRPDKRFYVFFVLISVHAGQVKPTHLLIYFLSGQKVTKSPGEFKLAEESAVRVSIQLDQ